MTKVAQDAFLNLEIDGERSTKKLLLVEDVESIQIAIRDFLFTRYDVTVASTAEEALMALAMGPDLDLVITDIKLPHMNGFEMARLARRLKPNIPIIIITSYDINDFIEVIRELGFAQVITKHGRMSLKEIEVTIEKMISRDIFGVHKYFPDLRVIDITNETFPKPFSNNTLYTTRVRSLRERSEISENIAAQFKSQKKAPEAIIKLVLDEITSNAMFRAPVTDHGDFKYQTKLLDHDVLVAHNDIALEAEDFFELQFGVSDEWIILVCIDPHGRLTQKEILYRLHRHLATNPKTGLPLGLHDTHGRGIFLLREQLSAVVFNIEQGKRTEVICLYNTIAAQAYKNISVYEIQHETAAH